MIPRPWQRQPDESAADFTAFVAYLRLKGRRSLRAAAAQVGSSPGVVRRLSARFNWTARVRAFEGRLAEASQDALDFTIVSTAAVEKARLEKLRLDEFQLAEDVLRAAERWLAVLANPRRHSLPLSQVLRLIDLASKLGRLAAGLPYGNERCPVAEPSELWTQPSVEAALEKIYGSASSIVSPEPPPSCVSPISVSTAPTVPLPVGSPLPHERPDLTPCTLTIGPHGLLCLRSLTGA